MTMELHIYKTLWGHNGSLDEAIAACVQNEFAGLEGQVPDSPAGRKKLQMKLAQTGLGFIAEICTAGSYVPRRQAALSEHVESLCHQAEAALDCNPRFLTVIAGCDAWSVEQSVNFFGEAMAIADRLGVPVSFETHRSRSLFNPWTTRDILRQLPALKLTCDFSHWCVVCERLVGDEPDVIALCAERAYHVHARVGYDQGPQVPHPAAPVHREALEAHERWWTQIWRNQSARGMAVSTLTPEFGPDGYLHSLPFTNVPVADLTQINHWMAGREKKLFGEVMVSAAGRTAIQSEPVSLAH